jgi:hypothetical protein
MLSTPMWFDGSSSGRRGSGLACGLWSGKYATCGVTLEVEARATIRLETPLGKQLQIDFGERRVTIGDENVKV